MSYLALINVGVTLVFALFVMGSTVCRITQIDMRHVRYVYVAPILMMFAWASSVFFSLIGGDTPDWYQPLCLFGIAVHLWTSKHDWRHGVPQYMLRRAAYVSLLNTPVRVVARVRFENTVVAVLTVLTIGATATGAVDGRGNPVQIYSAHAEPSIVVPGGNLVLKFSLRRVRACPGYVSRFILDENGDTVQNFGNTVIGGSEIGRRRDGVSLTLALDRHLPPGNYVYRAMLYHQCPDAYYTMRTPDVPFVVVPKTE